MKNYFEIYVGSRGMLEGIEIIGVESIEEYLNKKSEVNKRDVEVDFEEGDDEEYREEILGMWDWDKLGDGVYELGIGDEEKKIYVDIESEGYREWEKGVEGDVMYVEVNEVDRLLGIMLREFIEEGDE